MIPSDAGPPGSSKLLSCGAMFWTSSLTVPLPAPSSSCGRRAAGFLLVAVTLAACSATNPNSVAVLNRPIPENEGRVYVLRESQLLYSIEPLTVSVDEKDLGTLASGTFLVADLPVGPKTLQVAVLLSRSTTTFDLRPGGTVYILVAMKPSGLPPPSGAIAAAPAYPITDEPGLFSIRFLDRPSAMAELHRLSPTQ
jgi:hypothetical protein